MRWILIVVMATTLYVAWGQETESYKEAQEANKKAEQIMWNYSNDEGLKKITKFIRPFEIVPDPEICLMEQGIVCCGPATRSGCGAKCVSAGVPCRGCYGKPINVRDQGAKMVSAIASVIDSADPEEIDRIIATIPDPVGTFYRFSLPDSMLRRAQV